MTQDSKRPAFAWVQLVGSRPFFKRSTLEPLLHAFESFSEFTPETHSLEERSGTRFSHKAALQLAGGVSSEHTLQLKRKTKWKYHCLVGLGSHPSAVVNLDTKLSKPAWERVFELGEAISEACRPEILWVHLIAEHQEPFTEEWQRTQAAIDGSLTSPRHEYRQLGPGGLTMRTYLGNRLVELIGRELLETTPVEVTPVAGGLRLDLVSRPWEAEREALRAAWREATEHLKPAQVFAETQVYENGALRRTAGARFVPPPEF